MGDQRIASLDDLAGLWFLRYGKEGIRAIQMTGDFTLIQDGKEISGKKGDYLAIHHGDELKVYKSGDFEKTFGPMPVLGPGPKIVASKLEKKGEIVMAFRGDLHG